MLNLIWFVLSIFAISSEISDALHENEAISDIGMNFYREIPDTHVLKRPGVVYFNPYDCSYIDNGGSSIYYDPDICCEDSTPIQCDGSFPYQNYDGSCNNLNFLRLGMTETCFKRLTPAYYEGNGNLRKSIIGCPLPTPRDISLNILKDQHQPAIEATFLFTAYGQVIAHDMSKGVQPIINCCLPENANKEECIPIIIRPDDPFYSQFNTTCRSMQRDEECAVCKPAYRTQKNTVTAALDINILYGVSEEQVLKLRTNDGTGKMKSSGYNDGYLLPAGKDKSDPFCPKGQDLNCFISGDARVNLHATLTSLQTAFMREHNRIATELKTINQHWGEEKLFQEARKILIAEHQCIIYKEYLPILLGFQLVESFDLTVKQGSSGTMYEPQVKLGTLQEFTVASFRLHSMVPTYIGVSNLQFRFTYSNPTLIREGGILNITSGSYQVPSEMYDRWMVKDLSNYLGFNHEKPFGSDLSAIDIQRGRDHGLAPYVEVVKFCSGGTIIISSFEDLYELSLMSVENIMVLENVYNDVKDVDMWVGMQMEFHYPGSLLGPTATCINTLQFYSTQKGDRFYFDHVGPQSSFTADQRSVLKQCSMARILCDNTKITHITRNPFLLPSYTNPDVFCREIPKIDLAPWKEISVTEEDC